MTMMRIFRTLRAFKDAIASVDAVLFVTPEYNRSIPDELKNAIDWASTAVWSEFVHAEAVRYHRYLARGNRHRVAQQSLRSVLAFCNSPQMNAPEAYDQFQPDLINDEGVVSAEPTEKFLRNFMVEFHTFVGRVLQALPRDA